MDDKLFELMTKMYSEMQQGFDKVHKELKEVRNDMVKIEDKLETNSKTLFDGYKQNYEKLTNVEKKLEDISSKVEKQDVEIRVIKNVSNQ